MSLENMSSELPPQFYNLPQNFATLPELEYFTAGMIVSLANEIRALRLSIDSFHKRMNVEVKPNDGNRGATQES